MKKLLENLKSAPKAQKIGLVVLVVVAIFMAYGVVTTKAPVSKEISQQLPPGPKMKVLSEFYPESGDGRLMFRVIEVGGQKYIQNTKGAIAPWEEKGK